MSAEKLLEEKLSKKFNEFLSSTSSEVNQVVNLQQKQFSKELQEEKERMQFIIDEKDRDIDDLTSQFESLRKLKQQRTLRLYTAFTRRQNIRKLDQALIAWISYYSQKAKNKRMNTYTVNFYRRGIQRKIYKEWKNETQKMKREQKKIDTVKRIDEEIEKATQNVCDENDQLRIMISNLTEDLRNETLARNQMKFKFEQAMFRGISALNQENIKIHEDVMSHSHGFNDVSRNLLYTPDSIIHLNKS
jgi:hypothetical protein